MVLAYCLKKQLRAFFKRLVFYRIQSYCLAPCRFLGRLRHIVLSILAAIFFLPSLLPILIPLGNRSTKPRGSILAKTITFTELISVVYLLILRQKIRLPRCQYQNEMRKDTAIWLLIRRIQSMLKARNIYPPVISHSSFGHWSARSWDTSIPSVR